MNDLSNLLNITTLDIVRWCVIGLIVLVALIAAGVRIYKGLKKLVNSYSETEVKTRKRDEMLEKHEASINELKHADGQILQALGEIQNTLNTMEKRQDQLEQSEKKAKLNELKDRIGQIYRYCHPTKRISMIQKVALLGLIENVEELGEENSFVHEVVQPEIETWEVFED